MLYILHKAKQGFEDIPWTVENETATVVAGLFSYISYISAANIKE